MYKEEVIEQGENALNKMLCAREEYCSSKLASFMSEGFVDVIECSDFEMGCCINMVFVLILALPFLAIGKLEKKIRYKKAKETIKQAKIECELYIKKLQIYLSEHPDNRIILQACSAFLQNRYIGELPKKKVFFGLLNMNEDWRMRSIDMAIQEMKYHLKKLQEN